MAYLGIGYSGTKKTFLTDLVNENLEWLKGDRLPRFFGDSFLVLYDSNTAREFAKKCIDADQENGVIIYPMERPLKTGKSN
ncbi:MAG: hypothetical protein LBI42_06440 [Chitinispirillales bacterium]|jgi:hypothetical protein|nr:hypothetical protein [Chitinispirillales bacterium]